MGKIKALPQHGKNYNAIDAVKLFMAFAVIAVHTHIGENLGCTAKGILNDFLSLAVPFFFLSAGFLLAQKLKYPFSGEEDINTIKKYLVRMVKLYLIWTLVYLPMAIYHYADIGIGFLKSVLYYVRGFLLLGEQYNSWHLWYLLSTVWALLMIVFLLQRKVAPEKILIFGSVLFAIGIFITCVTGYEGNLPPALSAVNRVCAYTFASGRVFYGYFYLPAGMLLSKVKIPMPAAIFMTILGFGVNALLTQEYYNVPLTAVTAIGLFSIVSEIRLGDSSVFPFMRKMSTVIYFIHMYIWTGFYMLVYGEKTYGFTSFVATTLISSAMAAVYIVFKKKSSCGNTR